MVTWSKFNFRDLTELIVECYTKFAKMLYRSALQITFLAAVKGFIFGSDLQLFKKNTT